MLYSSLPSVGSIVACALTLVACANRGHARLAFASSDEPLVEQAPEPSLTPPTDRRVALLTIDGVRAKDVFEGDDPTLAGRSRPGATPRATLMPRTMELVAKRGVALGRRGPACPGVRTAGGANASLPGYLEIFTGQRTRCRNNACAAVELPTVLDEAAAAGYAPVASVASWEVLARAVSRGSPHVLVSAGTAPWPASHPRPDGELGVRIAEGERSGPFPGSGSYRPDASTTAVALAYVDVATPALLHVGLGDADEWAHKNDYPAYAKAVDEADAFLAELVERVDTREAARSRTTFIVTTDHGRNADFQHHGPFSLESGETFILAFGAGVPALGVVCPPRDVTLADIAPTIRVLLGLPADRSASAGRPIEPIVADAPAVAVSPRRPGHKEAAEDLQRP